MNQQERYFWYLRRHPVTEIVIPTAQAFIWDTRAGEWVLPDDQTHLPQMVAGTDFYDSQHEALEARDRDAHAQIGDGEDIPG